MSKPGVLGHIGLGAESTWGTGVPPTVWFPGTEEIGLTISRLMLEDPHGMVFPLPSQAGRMTAEGGLRGFPVYTEEFGHILKAALGAPTDSGTGPYTHTYAFAEPVAGDHVRPPYSVQVTKGAKTRRYVGGQVSRLSLAQRNDDYLKADLQMLFKSWDDSQSEATPTFPSSTVFAFRDLAVKKGGSDLGLRVEELTIELNNNLAAVTGLGSADLLAVEQNGQVSATAQLTLEFDDAAIYNDFVNDNGDKYEFIWTSGTDKLTVTMYRAVVAEHGDPLSGAGRLTATATLQAEYSTADGKFIEIELVNDTASY